MRAFHTLRTKNFSDFAPEDFELFTLIISALEWRKLNGEIFLYTDAVGKNFLERRGLTDCWNGIDSSLDEMDSLGVDEKVFWAGAKLFALQKQLAPCVMMDLDFIVWQPIDFSRFGANVAVIHREEKNLPCYPDKNFFSFTDNFALPQDLDWSLDPCNAALVYFGNKNFVDGYCNFAFKFMCNARPAAELHGWDLLPYMVFVEQRWLAMASKIFGVELHSLSTITELFGGQNVFTHIWGHKTFLRENPAAAKKFCRDCAGRIAHDFPTAAENFSRLDWAKSYFGKSNW